MSGIYGIIVLQLGKIPRLLNVYVQWMGNYLILEDGGPDGELGASLRYLSQRFAQTDKRGVALLTDIGVSVSEYDISKTQKEKNASVYFNVNRKRLFFLLFSVITDFQECNIFF